MSATATTTTPPTSRPPSPLEPPLQEIKEWDDFPDLDPDILRGIFSYGFESPSDIQQKAILPLMQGRDIVAQAQSGTGKTGAFVIGALSRINLEENAVQVIILSPTKELAAQTAKVVSAIGALTTPPVRVELMFGGSSSTECDSSVAPVPPHVICGCPGRIYDIIAANKWGRNTAVANVVNPAKVRLIVLDEADELLKPPPSNSDNMGFKEQIYNIFQKMPVDIQVALFTASMPAYMNNLVEKMMREPVIIKVDPERLTLDGIRQYYITVGNDFDKVNVLRTIYNKASISQSIIYCNSVNRVMQLYDLLKRDGYPVCYMHGKMERGERERVFNEFKGGKHRILISTDLTARGIDIQQVSLVINYDIPASEHTYLHRIGRGGRWGRKGVGINLVTQRYGDVQSMRNIESYYHCNIEKLTDDVVL